MRMSQLFSSTLRDVSSDAEVESHQLLLRAGYIRQLASGIFSYLPLAHRSHRKIEEIIQSIGADGLGAQNHKRFNNELINMLKNFNKSVHVWTVNSTDDAEYYIKKGVDSITTNRPYFLRNHLKKMK